jgi:hypothetical protein
VHYPTTAHDVMQKRSVSSGGVETGVMLGYIPADTDYRDIDQGSGRIAATIVYQPISNHPIDLPPISIYVPTRYQALLGRLYGQMGLRRERRGEREPVHAQAPPGQSTVLTTTHHQKRGLLSINVEQIDTELGVTTQRVMNANPAEITHIDLCLDEPHIDAAVNDLALLGFVYCGLLPGFARSDILRLQHLLNQPSSIFKPELVNSGARTILALIDVEHQPGA